MCVAISFIFQISLPHFTRLYPWMLFLGILLSLWCDVWASSSEKMRKIELSDRGSGLGTMLCIHFLKIVIKRAVLIIQPCKWIISLCLVSITYTCGYSFNAPNCNFSKALDFNQYNLLMYCSFILISTRI